MKNNSDLFYTCSLIERIGRTQKLKRADVVKTMGLPASTATRTYSTVNPLRKLPTILLKAVPSPRGTLTMLPPVATRCRTTGPSERSTSG